MIRGVPTYERRIRFLAAFLTASLCSGCQPAGTGSIDVDGTNQTIRGFKTIEPEKQPRAARTGKQPASTKSAPRNGFQ
jgi:hypothetical protein